MGCTTYDSLNVNANYFATVRYTPSSQICQHCEVLSHYSCIVSHVIWKLATLIEWQLRFTL